MLIALLVLCFINYSSSFPYFNEIETNRYHFKYSTVDSAREESGKFVQKEAEQVWVVKGYYFYKIQNVAYNISYVADDNGYKFKQTLVKKPQRKTNRIKSAVLASLAGGGIG